MLTIANQRVYSFVVVLLYSNTFFIDKNLHYGKRRTLILFSILADNVVDCLGATMITTRIVASTTSITLYGVVEGAKINRLLRRQILSPLYIWYREPTTPHNRHHTTSSPVCLSKSMQKKAQLCCGVHASLSSETHKMFPWPYPRIIVDGFTTTPNQDDRDSRNAAMSWQENLRSALVHNRTPNAYYNAS